LARYSAQSYHARPRPTTLSAATPVRQLFPSTLAPTGAVACLESGGLTMLQTFIVAILVAQSPVKGPTLTGVVKDPSGLPLAKATVFIRTAAPRHGVGVL